MTDTPHIHEPEQTEEVLYCTVHPDRETTLRCNKCGRPMCPECAVQTPVGYRCRECVRGIQDNYYKATSNDYSMIAAVCAGLSAVAGAVMSALSFGLLFTLILGLPIGGGIAEAALRLTSRRRGRQSARVAAASAVGGGLVGGIVQIVLWYNGVVSQMPDNARVPALSLDFIFQRLTTDFSLLLFVGLVAAAVYGRFKLRS